MRYVRYFGPIHSGLFVTFCKKTAIPDGERLESRLLEKKIEYCLQVVAVPDQKSGETRHYNEMTPIIYVPLFPFFTNSDF